MPQPTNIARLRFNEYAGLDASELPSGEMQALQVLLARWQNHNFGYQPLYVNVLGAVEEIGELAHAVLKNKQSIRGMDDEEAFREAAGDAIADAAIFLIQAATCLRLDFETLVAETAGEVMKRDWARNGFDGGQ